MKCDLEDMNEIALKVRENSDKTFTNFDSENLLFLCNTMSFQLERTTVGRDGGPSCSSI